MDLVHCRCGGLDCGGSHAQDGSDGIDITTGLLGDRQVLCAQHQRGGGISVDRVGLAASTDCSDGSDHPADLNVGREQHTGQAGPIRAGALDPDTLQRAVTGDEVQQGQVAIRGGRELAVGQLPARARDQRRVMGIGMGVDAGDDTDKIACHDG